MHLTMPPTHLFPPFAGDLRPHDDAFNLYREPTMTAPHHHHVHPAINNTTEHSSDHHPPPNPPTLRLTNNKKGREEKKQSEKDPFRIMLSFVTTAKTGPAFTVWRWRNRSFLHHQHLPCAPT